MNESVSRWLKALRSGEYQQTTGTLRDTTGYCCLGVACDLYMKETGRGSWGEPEADDTRYARHRRPFILNDYKEFNGLPGDVQRWLGLADENGCYTEEAEDRVDGRYTYSLAELNDAETKFDKIADKIEESPEGLF